LWRAFSILRCPPFELKRADEVERRMAADGIVEAVDVTADCDRGFDPALEDGAPVDVGNVCVKRFLGFRSDLIFQSLKRIRADRDKSIGPDAAAFFHERGVINGWEYQFQQSTMRKRNLSERQLATRRLINEKVVAAVRRRGLS
jgi:hypothetical protein